MSRITREFLDRCFAPEEIIAILLRRKEPVSVTQRVARLERALEPRYQAWLSYENCMGANIYVSANPLQPGSRKRTKETIASIRHLYIDIDMDGDTRLAAVRTSDSVPPPSAIVSTSPGKYQVLWRVEGFDFDQQEQTLKRLAIAFGGDPACTDCNRVLRIPGFLNRKYSPPHRISIEYPSASVSTPDHFRLDADTIDPTLFASASTPRRPSSKHSHSESDWAWVCDQLAHGKDAETLTRELASRRSDKPNPHYYARRTEGIRVCDIITMLESRRRFEIPATLCLARAREIASTAERMIARGKSA